MLTEGTLRVCCRKLIIINHEIASPVCSTICFLSNYLLFVPVTCELLSAEVHKELPRVITTLTRLGSHLSTSPQRTVLLENYNQRNRFEKESFGTHRECVCACETM